MSDLETNVKKNGEPVNPAFFLEVTEAQIFTGSRCKKIKSGGIRIKNPKIISMEWDKKAIYYGDKAALRIKTFELSSESPVCRLQLWEKDFTAEGGFILEQDITINSDEIETEIKFDFDVEGGT